MAKEEGRGRATVKGRLELGRLERAKLLYTMRLFREAVEKAHHMRKKGVAEKEIKKSLYWTIPNTHYCESAYKKALLYANQEHLKLKHPLLFSIGKGAKRENGNRNIQIDGDRIRIKIPHADGKHEWIEGRIKTSERYLPILEELRNYSYSAGISLKGCEYYVYLNIPIELYAKIEKNEDVHEDASHIASFDINSDRINCVLLRENGELIEVRNHHFQEVNSPGYPKEKARDTRLKALAELIDYAVAHGARIFVFERMGKKNKKDTGSKTGNRKLSRFAARELLSHAEIMVKKRGGVFKQVSAAYCSKIARIIHCDLGMDVHTASALVLGLRYLRTLNDLKNHQSECVQMSI